MERILIFSLAYYPYVGGAEVAVKELTDRLPDFEFHLVTLRQDRALPREEKIGNVFVHRVGFGSAYISKILFVPAAAIAARRLHSKYRFDALWAIMTYMLFPIALTRMLGVRVPYILTLQDGDPFEYVFKRRHILPFAILLSWGFRHAAVVQAISNFLGEWARRMGYKGPIEIIPNGVDYIRFAREKIPHQGIVLITTSRLVHKNAVDDVIRVLPLLSDDVTFKILGTGPEEAVLKKLAKELGVQHRVEFLGHVDHTDMPRYLHAADIFVRPSRSEGQGASFIEAMAAGLPIIATQEGGIADFLFDPKRDPGKQPTGFAVDKDRPDQIALAIKDILSNPMGTAQVVESARAMVRERYGWDLLAGQMRERVFGRIFKTS